MTWILIFGLFATVNGLLGILSDDYNDWIDTHLKKPIQQRKPEWMKRADDWLTRQGMTDRFVRYESGIQFTVIGLIFLTLYFSILLT